MDRTGLQCYLMQKAKSAQRVQQQLQSTDHHHHHLHSEVTSNPLVHTAKRKGQGNVLANDFRYEQAQERKVLPLRQTGFSYALTCPHARLLVVPVHVWGLFATTADDKEKSCET